MTEKDEVREHSFDGIQEYDNDLPRWWIWLFVITVVASVIYPFVYDFGPSDFASETIDQEMAALEKTRLLSAPAASESDESSLLGLVGNDQTLKDGQQIYVSRCLACHGGLGEGIVGPNLTDDYWIHGGKITDLHKVVVNGVLEKGMLPWKDQLTPQQINAVVAYVWTLHDTNPPNAKAPQGDKVERP